VSGDPEHVALRQRAALGKLNSRSATFDEDGEHADGDTIRVRDLQGLAELKRLSAGGVQPSTIVDPPSLEDRLFSLPVRRSKWPIFLSGVMIGFLGFLGAFLGAWLWLAQG
jgi:hypothetical protein